LEDVAILNHLLNFARLLQELLPVGGWEEHGGEERGGGEEPGSGEDALE
jgi:hypothetical protein